MCKFVKIHEIVNVNFRKATISGNTTEIGIRTCFSALTRGRSGKGKGGREDKRYKFVDVT